MLSDLISDLKSNLTTASGGCYLTDAQASRVVERALPLLCADLDRIWELAADGSVSPAMEGQVRELWLLRSLMNAYRLMMAQTAANHSWKSDAEGSSADRKQEPTNWKNLLEVTGKEYGAAVSRRNPAYADPDTVEMDYIGGFAERGSLGCYDPDPEPCSCSSTRRF